MFGRKKQEKAQSVTIQDAPEQFGINQIEEKVLPVTPQEQPKSMPEVPKLKDYFFITSAIALENGEYQYTVISDQRLSPGLQEDN